MARDFEATFKRTVEERDGDFVAPGKTRENVNMQNQVALIAITVVIVLGMIAIAVVATRI